jgi:hypothetical protein
MMQVLQEVSAARIVVFMCGKTELKDGFLRALSTVAIRGDLGACMHRPVSPIIELTQRKSIDQPLYPLGQLIDMFHTHEATDQRDKIYALLGMSADQGDSPKIRPDYTRTWSEVFQQTISHVLGPGVMAITWENSSQSIIYGSGYIFGCITHVADKPKPNWLFVISIHEQDGTSRWTASCKVPSYAKPIETGDILCFIEEAQRPCIIRPHRDHFDVIVASLPPPLNTFDQGQKPTVVEWANLVDRSAGNERNLLLVWDWESSDVEIGQKHEATLTNFRVSSIAPRGAGPGETDESSLRRFLVQKVLEDVRNGPRDLQHYVGELYGTWHRVFNVASTSMRI